MDKTDKPEGDQPAIPALPVVPSPYMSKREGPLPIQSFGLSPSLPTQVPDAPQSPTRTRPGADYTREQSEACRLGLAPPNPLRKPLPVPQPTLIHIANFEEVARRALVGKLNDRGIPARHAKHILQTQEGTLKLKDTKALRSVQEHLSDPEERFIVMAGRYGNGKTFAGCLAVAQESPDEYRHFRNDCIDDTRSSEGLLLRPPWPNELHPRFISASHLGRLDEYRGELRPFERCSILCIDDIGKEYADKRGFFIQRLQSLLNERYNADVRTILTTNLSKPEFKKYVGQHIVERITEHGHGRIIGIDEPSLRGEVEPMDVVIPVRQLRRR